MNIRNALLGSAAVVGAAAVVVPSTAAAFDVDIDGRYRFDTVVGDLDEALNSREQLAAGTNLRRSYDFAHNARFRVRAAQVDDETGIRYGTLLTINTQNNDFNVGAAYLFVDGAFGGLRFGDDDGAADNSKVTAANIAAGTGGIDGAGAVSTVDFFHIDSGLSTKIRYDSPSIAGFTLHGSFTPNAGTRGSTIKSKAADQYEDWVELALVYTGSFGDLDLQAGGTYSFNQGKRGVDDFQGFNLGAVVGFQGFRIAGNYWEEDDSPTGIGGARNDRKGYALAAAASLGPADLSISWADIVDADSNEEGQNLVLSATMGLLPGLTLEGDVSFFDRDLQGTGSDDGVAGVVRLNLNF